MIPVIFHLSSPSNLFDEIAGAFDALGPRVPSCACGLSPLETPSPSRMNAFNNGLYPQGPGSTDAGHARWRSLPSRARMRVDRPLLWRRGEGQFQKRFKWRSLARSSRSRRGEGAASLVPTVQCLVRNALLRALFGPTANWYNERASNKLSGERSPC